LFLSDVGVRLEWSALAPAQPPLVSRAVLLFSATNDHALQENNDSCSSIPEIGSGALLNWN